MSIHNLIQTDSKMLASPRSFHGKIKDIVSRYSEGVWFCLSFILFLVMGPFSVFAVLVGLYSLATGEQKEKMVEPASC